MTADEVTAPPPGAAAVWWIALVAHLFALPWYAVSGLVAPGWAVALLLVVWAVLLGVGVRLRRRRPFWMLIVPPLDVVVWLAVIVAGDAFLGWTA